jgi:deoxyadenosine/deoxycytidine kinase
MKIIEDSTSTLNLHPIPDIHDLKIGVVGPCSSGKTSLVDGLNKSGFNAHHIAQEHSYVPYMWQRISKPDILIFLDVTFPISQQRRSLNWKISDFEEQQKRLAHARKHADLIVNTDDRSISEILTGVLEFLDAWVVGKRSTSIL